jgi:hypothetical protein
MNPEKDIEGLLRAKKRTERRLKEIVQQIDHLNFRLDEEVRCFSRRCPFNLDEDCDHDAV